MKTITEFAVLTLKNAAKTKAELTAAGKTPEELPAALGEALKLEGDKLNFIVNALEAVGPRLDDLKRVIVSSLAEGESAPSNSKKMGEHVYTIENYGPIGAKPQNQPDDRKDKGHRGDKRGGGGKKSERGGQNDRGGRGGDRNAAPRGPSRPPTGVASASPGGGRPIPNKT